MVELKWNLQFHFNSGHFHFAIPIPIPIPWLAIPIPIPIPELELELKSIPIPIPELTPALIRAAEIFTKFQSWSHKSVWCCFCKFVFIRTWHRCFCKFHTCSPHSLSFEQICIIVRDSKLFTSLWVPGSHGPWSLSYHYHRALGMGPIIDVFIHWKF